MWSSRIRRSNPRLARILPPLRVQAQYGITSKLEEVATMVRGTKKTAFALALGAVTVLGACKKTDNAADTTMASADTSMAAGAASSTMNAPAPAATMSDAAIFAMLGAANQGEIAAGKMAESKATNASVKSFARDMVAAHTKMLNDGVALAKRLNITPD